MSGWLLPGSLAVGTAALALTGAGVIRQLRRSRVLVTVDGSSMRPTFTPGDRVLVRRVRPELIRTGDVVVAEKPVDGIWLGPAPSPEDGVSGRYWIIKRAVAVPGDPVPASSLPDPSSAGAPVPVGSFVLLGDNRAGSFDSRIVGFFPADRILGVVLRRVARTPGAPARTGT